MADQKTVFNNGLDSDFTSLDSTDGDTEEPYEHLHNWYYYSQFVAAGLLILGPFLTLVYMRFVQKNKQKETTFYCALMLFGKVLWAVYIVDYFKPNATHMYQLVIRACLFIVYFYSQCLVTWLFFFRYYTATNSMINLLRGTGSEKQTKILYIIKIIGIISISLACVAYIVLIVIGYSTIDGFNENYDAALKAFAAYMWESVIIYIVSFVLLMFLASGICRVRQIGKFVPKLKASNTQIALHTFFLVSVVIADMIIIPVQVTGHLKTYWYFMILGVYLRTTHNFFILYMILKFGQQSLISVKYRPNGAMVIVVSQTNQVIYERNLTTVQQALQNAEDDPIVAEHRQTFALNDDLLEEDSSYQSFYERDSCTLRNEYVSALLMLVDDNVEYEDYRHENEQQQDQNSLETDPIDRSIVDNQITDSQVSHRTVESYNTSNQYDSD